MLLSFYGDDFTGSTDVMESMSVHGIKTVLFTRIPTPQEQARFAGYDAVGAAAGQVSGWLTPVLLHPACLLVCRWTWMWRWRRRRSASWSWRTSR